MGPAKWAVGIIMGMLPTSAFKCAMLQTAPGWRLAVDKILAPPWRAPTLAQKAILLQDLIKRLPEVADDVSGALKAGRLVEDVLLVEGSEAKQTADAMRAVNRQLQEDILPAVAREGPQSTARALQQLGGELPRLLQQSATQAASVSQMLSDPARVQQALASVPQEVINVFSSTPEGLYTPRFTVVQSSQDYQIRDYEPYSICCTPMSGLSNDEGAETTGSGDGFNTLAGYIFGGNEGRQAMAMTTPVAIERGRDGSNTMSFVMSREFTGATAPQPTNAGVTIRDIPPERLAVREFPGFATPAEIKRQLASLQNALIRDAKPVEDPSFSQYRVLQYNAPYTVPWLRRNEVAVKLRLLPRQAPAEDSPNMEAQDDR